MRLVMLAAVGLLACRNDRSSNEPVIAIEPWTPASEIAAVSREVALREEQLRIDIGIYLSTGVSEIDTFPSANRELPKPWLDLGVQLPAVPRCSYVVIARNSSMVAGPLATTLFGFNPPASDWYYLLGRCAGSDGITYYFSSSLDGSLESRGPDA